MKAERHAEQVAIRAVMDSFEKRFKEKFVKTEKVWTHENGVECLKEVEQ